MFRLPLLSPRIQRLDLRKHLGALKVTDMGERGSHTEQVIFRSVILAPWSKDGGCPHLQLALGEARPRGWIGRWFRVQTSEL